MPKIDRPRDLGRTIAGIETTIVRKEFVPIVEGDGHSTMGAAIDAHLLKCAEENVLVQDIRLMFEEENWHEYSRAIRERYGSKMETDY